MSCPHELLASLMAEMSGRLRAAGVDLTGVFLAVEHDGHMHIVTNVHPDRKAEFVKDVVAVLKEPPVISRRGAPGDHVVDPFAGSGSTGVAAAKLNRRCTLIELSNCEMHPVAQ